MFRERLEQYYYMLREIQLLEVQILKAVNTKPSFPGEAPDSREEVKKLRQRRTVLLLEKQELEEFVEGVEDNRLRLILTLRYLEGLEWGEVAARLGYKESIDSVRKASVRFLKKMSDMSAVSGKGIVQ